MMEQEPYNPLYFSKIRQIGNAARIAFIASLELVGDARVQTNPVLAQKIHDQDLRDRNWANLQAEVDLLHNDLTQEK